MKKQKMKLAELNVESFTTSETKEVNGGVLFTVTIVATYTLQGSLVLGCFGEDREG